MTLTAARKEHRIIGRVLTALAVAVLLQACGQSGKSTGPSGNSSVAVGLKKASGQLPTGCTGTATATGPVIRTGTIAPNGQVTLAGLVPGTYVFSALLDCSPNGTFAGQSPPTQIVDGVNNITIEITTAPIDVGVKCDASQLTPGQSTTCHCQGSLITGGTPTFSWSGAPSGSTSKDPSFTFPQPGTFNISCLVSNGPISKESPKVTVQVTTPPPQTGTIEITNGEAALFFERLRLGQRRSMASGLVCCDLKVNFDDPSVPDFQGLPATVGQNVKTISDVKPGTYGFEFFFNFEGYSSCGRDSITVVAGQTAKKTLSCE